MILAAAVCFATIPTFAKLAYDHGTDPLGLLTVRFVIGGAVMWLMALIWRGRPRWSAQHRYLPLLAVIFAAQSLSFFESLNHTSAVLTVLLLYTYPLIVTLLAPALLGERLTLAKLIIVGVGFAGIALTLGGFTGTLDHLGIALGFASGVLFAAFLLLAKRHVSASLDPLEMVAWIYGGIGIGYLIVLGFHGASFPDNLNGWAALSGAVFVGTVASMILFASGLRHLPAGVTSMLSTLEPACSVALAAIVLGESVSALQFIGICLVLASISWLGYLVLRTERPEVYVDPL